MARYPDPGALATDAFLLDWSQMDRVYPSTNSPDPANSTPDEAGQGNRSDDCPDPDFLEMLVDYPARLPVSPSTISLPFSQEEVHPLWRTLQLVVWPISGHVSKQQDFQKKCAKSSWHHGEEVLRDGTRDHKRNYDQAGVFNGRSVHFQFL